MPQPAAHWWIDTASGAAPAAVQVLFASYAELNPEARKTRDVLDVLGATMLDSEAGETLSRTIDPTDLTPTPSNDVLCDPIYPSPMRALGLRHDVSPWRSRLGGISARKLAALSEPGIDARLFKIEPGASIPSHDHDGDEFTLVLTGGFADQDDVYHRGELACGRPGYVHQPRGLPGEPCICFAVSIGGYRFRNPLMSLAASWLK